MFLAFCFPSTEDKIGSEEEEREKVSFTTFPIAHYFLSNSKSSLSEVECKLIHIQCKRERESIRLDVLLKCPGIKCYKQIQ